MKRAGSVLVGGLLLAAKLSAQTSTATTSDAPLFEPPPPGSYELPAIARVADFELLAPDGARVPVLGLAKGQVALVAFVYRACSDAEGCPAALATLKRIDVALAQRRALAGHVRLVTVSFDPAHDTPERMGELASHLAPASDWRFLTAADGAELAPLLAAYGQDVTALVGPQGEPTGAIRHVVKVYLVDSRRDVRNVYSTGFLSVPLLLADLETVVAE
jgi:cytochrome oxidase Cu insertion factor (SCO1/SenC/PrrC family)